MWTFPIPKLHLCFVLFCQALRHLCSVQVINFGDCLVRSEGAIAITAALRGLPVLKVSIFN